MNNSAHAGSLFPTRTTKREKSAKQEARFEQHIDGWWASRILGQSNILGHGSTQEEALADLKHQVAGFLDFLKEHRKRRAGVARIGPDYPFRPASRARLAARGAQTNE
jgi:hypothetical protein